MDSFRFESWMWLLLIPVFVILAAIVGRRRRRPAVVFSSIADLKDLPVTMLQRVRRILPLIYGVALCLIIVGMARPQSGRSESRITGEGIAIELVLDISNSMEAVDFQLAGKNVSRLEAVKHVISEFVLGSRSSGLTGRKDDLVGVVAFGGFADSKCPLTLDHGAVVDIVQGLEIPKPVRDRRGNIINEQTLMEELKTAIGDGVALGVDRLRGAKAKSKVLVLLTDGDSNAGVIDPREAAAVARDSGVKCYTIGIGQNGAVPFPQEDRFGNRVLVSAHFPINEELLREIAQTTGGEYFHASNLAGLSRVYAEIDRLEKTEFGETKYSEYTELFRWFAGPGLILALVIGVLNETRFRTLP